MHIFTPARGTARLTAPAIALAALAAACGIEKQTAPDLAGPSEFGLSISLTATPDSIVQDGASQSVIQIVARSADGRPRSGVVLQMSATSSDGNIRGMAFTADTVVTDNNGQATLGLIAPPPPATMPLIAPVIYVNATPVGGDAQGAAPRQIQVRLVAPAGTPLPNHDPTASFTIVPATGNVGQSLTLDASATMDEGQPCGSRCTYLWDFGDFTTGNGITVSKSYNLPQSYTITLTVRDEQGGVSSTQRTVTINGPSAPVANFTVTPSAPTAGTNVVFNGSLSTVGTGATIAQYAWDFGDNSATVVSTSATTTKSYGAAGTYLVSLTVTDSLGRTATRTATLTVQ